MPNEQLPLIDIGPENAKEITRLAKEYKEAMHNRVKWLAKEKEKKNAILEAVHAAKLKPTDDGVIRFTVDDVLITVTPRDELVRVKDIGAEEED